MSLSLSADRFATVFFFVLPSRKISTIALHTVYDNLKWRRSRHGRVPTSNGGVSKVEGPGRDGISIPSVTENNVFTFTSEHLHDVTSTSIFTVVKRQISFRHMCRSPAATDDTLEGFLRRASVERGQTSGRARGTRASSATCERAPVTPVRYSLISVHVFHKHTNVFCF